VRKGKEAMPQKRNSTSLNESPSPRYRVKGKRNKCSSSELKVHSSMKVLPPHQQGRSGRKRVQEKSSSNVNIDSSMKAHPLVRGEKKEESNAPTEVKYYPQ
jgi:hypothetical protein